MSNHEAKNIVAAATYLARTCDGRLDWEGRFLYLHSDDDRHYIAPVEDLVGLGAALLAADAKGRGSEGRLDVYRHWRQKADHKPLWNDMQP